MRATLVMNPSSGRGNATQKLAAIHTAFRDLGLGYQVLTIGRDGGLEAVTRRILDERPDRVLVCGGDGTVTSVGTALLYSGIPIGPLPGGTANAIARTLGIPTRLTDATRFVLTEEPHPFDAVRVNQRISLLTSGAGFDSDVIATADGELKRRFGVLAYVWAGLTHLGALSETVFEVSVDGAAPVKIGGHCLLFANIGRLFGEFDLFVNSQPDDGRVDVAVLTLSQLAELLSLSGRALTGLRHPEERSAFFIGRSVDVRFSRPLRTQIDGEAGGEAEAMNAEVLPGALQVIRSVEPRKPLIQVPAWVEAVADSLMGLESGIEEPGDGGPGSGEWAGDGTPGDESAGDGMRGEATEGE